MLKWVAVLIVVLVLILTAEIIYLRNLPEKKEIAGENVVENVVEKTTCEFNGKTYQLDESFIFEFNSSTNLCRCGKDGLPACRRTYRQGERPDEM